MIQTQRNVHGIRKSVNSVRELPCSTNTSEREIRVRECSSTVQKFCLTTFFSFSFFHLPFYFEEFESQRGRRKKVPFEQTVKERNRLLYSFKQQSQKFLLSSDSLLVFFFTFLLLFRNIVPQLCR